MGIIASSSVLSYLHIVCPISHGFRPDGISGSKI